MARTMKADRQMPNTGGWQDRHDTAISSAPIHPFESAVVQMIKGWSKYAFDHKARYEDVIGNDGVLGPAWEQMGDSLRTLLNGETGRLDCGTLGGFILDTLKENGVDTENK